MSYPWTLTTDENAPYLAPHPWDGIGKPPRPGMVYDPPIDVDVAVSMAEMLRSADSQYEEAESFRDEAQGLEREADRLRSEAEALATKVNHPALVHAIQAKPSDFRAEADITAWMEGRR